LNQGGEGDLTTASASSFFAQEVGVSQDEDEDEDEDGTGVIAAGSGEAADPGAWGDDFDI